MYGTRAMAESSFIHVLAMRTVSSLDFGDNRPATCEMAKAPLSLSPRAPNNCSHLVRPLLAAGPLLSNPPATAYPILQDVAQGLVQNSNSDTCATGDGIRRGTDVYRIIRRCHQGPQGALETVRPWHPYAVPCDNGKHANCTKGNR